MWQLFFENAGTGCGKRDNCPFHNGFHVPEHPGTCLGQVGTNLGRVGLNLAFAVLAILSGCVVPRDSGTDWDVCGAPVWSLKHPILDSETCSGNDDFKFRDPKLEKAAMLRLFDLFVGTKHRVRFAPQTFNIARHLLFFC